MSENHFRSDFYPFHIDKQLYFFLEIFDKMAAGGHFGCPQITFDRFSGHFRSMSKISKKNKVVYRCEMDRNQIESDFRTSKMANGNHFVKKKKSKIIKVVYQSEMARNQIETHDAFCISNANAKSQMRKIYEDKCDLYSMSSPVKCSS